jgi:hypothetical protein
MVRSRSSSEEDWGCNSRLNCVRLFARFEHVTWAQFEDVSWAKLFFHVSTMQNNVGVLTNPLFPMASVYATQKQNATAFPSAPPLLPRHPLETNTSSTKAVATVGLVFSIVALTAAATGLGMALCTRNGLESPVSPPSEPVVEEVGGAVRANVISTTRSRKQYPQMTPMLPLLPMRASFQTAPAPAPAPTPAPTPAQHVQQHTRHQSNVRVA